MDLRAQRAAENEQLFRRINERVATVSTGRALTLVCECADDTCLERIPGIAPAEYEAVRRNDGRFFVVPGHERPDVERVVDARAGYLVVEKPVA